MTKDFTAKMAVGYVGTATGVKEISESLHSVGSVSLSSSSLALVGKGSSERKQKSNEKQYNYERYKTSCGVMRPFALGS